MSLVSARALPGDAGSARGRLRGDHTDDRVAALGQLLLRLTPETPVGLATIGRSRFALRPSVGASPVQNDLHRVVARERSSERLEELPIARRDDEDEPADGLHRAI